MTRSDHWREHARRWSHFGPPLRPSPEDLAVVARAVAERDSPSVLVLGVTPELVGGRWPAGTRLVAVDRSADMIGALWPARGAPDGARVLCADWHALPIAGGTIDVVVGDGALNTLAWPAGCAIVAGEIARVLRRGGRWVSRVYLRPDEPEPVDAIARDLEGGRIGSVHVLKWRLAAALHGALTDGVRLADVWDAWRRVAPLAVARGWSADDLATLDGYRGVATRYVFPTLPELRAALAPRFVERACVAPTYELGERCPSLILDAR